MIILTCAVPYAENPIPPKTFIYVKDAPRKLPIFYCHFPCTGTISNAYMPTRFVAKASGIEDGERELNALMEETGWRTVLEYVRDPNGSNEGIPVRSFFLIFFLSACDVKKQKHIKGQKEKPTIKRPYVPDIKRWGHEGV